MAKANIEEEHRLKPVPLKEDTRTRLVTVLYSQAHYLYRVPSVDKPCWLSVKLYDLPPTQLLADTIYLGAATSADGYGWRKAYARTWRSIIAGDAVTLAADDPMVRDYESFGREAKS